MNCCGFVEQNSAMELSGKHLVVGNECAGYLPDKRLGLNTLRIAEAD